MSLEIDYKAYIALADKYPSFISNGQRYMVIDGVLLTVQPSKEENEQQKEEVATIYSDL